MQCVHEFLGFRLCAYSVALLNCALCQNRIAQDPQVTVITTAVPDELLPAGVAKMELCDIRVRTRDWQIFRTHTLRICAQCFASFVFASDPKTHVCPFIMV